MQVRIEQDRDHVKRDISPAAAARASIFCKVITTDSWKRLSLSFAAASNAGMAAFASTSFIL
jgi:hypothetical protein